MINQWMFIFSFGSLLITIFAGDTPKGSLEELQAKVVDKATDPQTYLDMLYHACIAGTRKRRVSQSVCDALVEVGGKVVDVIYDHRASQEAPQEYGDPEDHNLNAEHGVPENHNPKAENTKASKINNK